MIRNTGMRGTGLENGYHRVLIYGDFREEVKEFAVLMGIRVVEEDQ